MSGAHLLSIKQVCFELWGQCTISERQRLNRWFDSDQIKFVLNNKRKWIPKSEIERITGVHDV